MEKFLKVTNAPVTGQLIAINGIKAVATANATAATVTIKYFDGTTTTVTTAAQVGSDVYTEILNAIETAIATSWQKAYYEVVLPKAVTSILNA
jgi:ribosomal protein L18|tara:strand:- start:240 stop:518 length:279 start_codon:yes stop_codon:yes gene_type:complete